MADTASTTKVFTVTGNAAIASGGTRKRRNKKRTTATAETMKVGKEQHGGTSPGTSLQVEANRAPGGLPPPPANFKNSTSVALAKTTTDSSPAPVQGGGSGSGSGSKPVKVVLEKKKATRVVLAPTKVKKLNPMVPAVMAKTRKVAKKIRMSLNGFGKRMTRAHTIRTDAKKQTIEDVKKTLVEAKLIKAESKAPDAVLRQMYSDYMMLKNRAL